MKVLFFDCETTGLLKTAPIEKQPRIIDIGAILFDTKSSDLPKYLGTLINPHCEVPKDITDLTGIHPYQLYDQPDFSDVLPALQALMSSAEVFVAHNAYFDVNMLKLEATRAKADIVFPPKIVCTVNETSAILGHKMSLTELWKYTFGEGDQYEEKHRAINDANDLCLICSALKIPVEAYYGK